MGESIDKDEEGGTGHSVVPLGNSVGKNSYIHPAFFAHDPS